MYGTLPVLTHLQTRTSRKLQLRLDPQQIQQLQKNIVYTSKLKVKIISSLHWQQERWDRGPLKLKTFSILSPKDRKKLPVT